MTRPIVYTCITNGYDRLADVDPSWDCDFVLFHDGSVQVPRGWTGRLLEVNGLQGIDLNRYAKMLPHRLAFGSDRSLYVDGNIEFRSDPRAAIDAVLAEAAFAGLDHPERDCAFVEMRHALRIGFMPAIPAWRMARTFRKWRLPRRAGLFEANVLYRRHDDPSVIAVCETWWKLWQQGLRRDQPLLMAANWRAGSLIRSLGPTPVHDPDSTTLRLRKHMKKRDYRARVARRILAELCLFRAWLPR
jgi:hypothetical protein